MNSLICPRKPGFLESRREDGEFSALVTAIFLTFTAVVPVRGSGAKCNCANIAAGFR
jgi:hypothetical protein